MFCNLAYLLRQQIRKLIFEVKVKTYCKLTKTRIEIIDQDEIETVLNRHTYETILNSSDECQLAFQSY